VERSCSPWPATSFNPLPAETTTTQAPSALVGSCVQSDLASPVVITACSMPDVSMMGSGVYKGRSTRRPQQRFCWPGACFPCEFSCNSWGSCRCISCLQSAVPHCHLPNDAPGSMRASMLHPIELNRSVLCRHRQQL